MPNSVAGHTAPALSDSSSPHGHRTLGEGDTWAGRGGVYGGVLEGSTRSSVTLLSDQILVETPFP